MACCHASEGRLKTLRQTACHTVFDKPQDTDYTYRLCRKPFPQHSDNGLPILLENRR